MGMFEIGVGPESCVRVTGTEGTLPAQCVLGTQQAVRSASPRRSAFSYRRL